jgi:crotonobetainyl-CoA:carnitine CoA-transferase CaiB-like acyl-CoA transferase
VGEYIDLSQIEALTTFIGAELIDAQINHRDPERRGNSRAGFVPHGVFPCQPPDRWVAIVARDDAEWARLCEVMDRADLLAREDLRGIAGRTANARAIHDAVSAWTRPRTSAEIAGLLRAAAIPVSPVMRPTTLMNDEQLWAREFFQLQDRAEVGTHPYPGPFVRLSATPGRLDRPAPLFGEHTGAILRDLGLSDDEIRALDEAGITSTTPLEQGWR